MARKKRTSNPITSVGCVCRFEFQHREARDVYIAGSFNNWHPNATPMLGLGEGRWLKELVLPSGRHEYRFVVNGKWTDDPSAKEVVPNPHGGVNAVLTAITT